MPATLTYSSLFKVLASVLIAMMLLFSVPAVAFAEGGGGEGGGGVGAAVGAAVAGFAAAVGAAVGAVGAAVAGFAAGFAAASPSSMSNSVNNDISLAELDKAPTVANAIGNVVGYNSIGQSVVDQANGQGFAAVADGGADGFGGGLGGSFSCEDTNSCVTTCPDGSPLPCDDTEVCSWRAESCYSPANACLGFAVGTRQVCRSASDAIVQQGACSVTDAPATPSYLGESCSSNFVNACGAVDYGFGFRNCANVCSDITWPTAVSQSSCSTDVCPAGFTGTPPSCTRSVCPTGYTGTPPNCSRTECPANRTPVTDSTGAITACVADEVGLRASIEARPSIVLPDGTVQIVWSSADALYCSVSADNNTDVWSTTAGSKTSSPITRKTTYTVTCTDISLQKITDTATVYVVPNWQEF